jgi:hypothetical protein
MAVAAMSGACGGKRGTEEEGKQRERERVRGFGVSSWRPHLLQAATTVACIRRVDGQGIDSELFPWTKEEDGAVAIGLGFCWADSCCARAANKRERRKNLGRTWPGEKIGIFSYTLFSNSVSSFKHFVVVYKHLEIQT